MSDEEVKNAITAKEDEKEEKKSKETKSGVVEQVNAFDLMNSQSEHDTSGISGDRSSQPDEMMRNLEIVA